MRRISEAARLLVLPLIALTIGLSSTAKADRDYCNRTDSKAQGTIIGGVAGAGGVAAAGGKPGGIIAGAIGGAVLGRLFGHSKDVEHERRDCGPDSEVEIRKDREADERYDREQDRQAQIDSDRARAAGRRDQYESSRRPRYQPPFMCVSLGRDRFGESFGILDVRRNEIVENTGYDYNRCQRHLDRWMR